MLKRGYKNAVRGVEASLISAIVDEYVHSDRDREIIKMNLIHNISYTAIADRLEPWISTRTVQNVMNEWMPLILEHIKR